MKRGRFCGQWFDPRVCSKALQRKRALRYSFARVFCRLRKLGVNSWIHTCFQRLASPAVVCFWLLHLRPCLGRHGPRGSNHLRPARKVSLRPFFIPLAFSSSDKDKVNIPEVAVPEFIGSGSISSGRAPELDASLGGNQSSRHSHHVISPLNFAIGHRL